jgi:hypothetical protein
MEKEEKSLKPDLEYCVNRCQELICDNCREVMGAVYDFDLQGNEFFCLECMKLLGKVEEL